MKGRYTTKAPLGVGYMSRHQEGWIYIRHQLRGFDIHQRQQGVHGIYVKVKMDLEKCDDIKTASSELFIKLKNTLSISEYSFE